MAGESRPAGTYLPYGSPAEQTTVTNVERRQTTLHPNVSSRVDSVLDPREMDNGGATGGIRKRRFGELQSRETSSAEPEGAICFTDKQPYGSHGVPYPRKLGKVNADACSKYMELAFIPKPSEPQPEPGAAAAFNGHKSFIGDFFNPPKEDFVHCQSPESLEGSLEPESVGPTGGSSGGEEPYPLKDVGGTPKFNIIAECTRNTGQDIEPVSSEAEQARECFKSPLLGNEPCFPSSAEELIDVPMSPLLEIVDILESEMNQALNVPVLEPESAAVSGSEQAIPAQVTETAHANDVGHESPALDAEPTLCSNFWQANTAPGVELTPAGNFGQASPAPDAEPNLMTKSAQASPASNANPCILADIEPVVEVSLDSVLDIGPDLMSEISQASDCPLSLALDIASGLPNDVEQVMECPGLGTEPNLLGNIGQLDESQMSPGMSAANCAMTGSMVVCSESPDSRVNTEICFPINEMVAYTVDGFMQTNSAMDMNFGNCLPSTTVDEYLNETQQGIEGIPFGGYLPSSTLQHAEAGTNFGGYLPHSRIESNKGSQENPNKSDGCGFGAPVNKHSEGAPDADDYTQETPLSSVSQMDSILQRLMDLDAEAEETTSPVTKKSIQWIRAPAKLIGLDPGPTAPGPSTCTDIAEYDEDDAIHHECGSDAEWRSIPGVEYYDTVQLDKDLVLEFKGAQAEYKRVLNRCIEIENVRLQNQKGIRRPDLRAMQEFPQTEWLNQGPIIGHLPGVAVNTVFEYKAEMHVLGVHKGHSRGISYLPRSRAKPGLPIALSICMSEQYDYDEENGFYDAWYTGEGGNFTVFQRKHEKRNQAMKRGNEALCNSMNLKLPVRVVKKLAKKHYVYDGLWDVIDLNMGQEEGKVIYRFRVQRRDKQDAPLREAITYTTGPIPKHVDFTVGVITDDLSCGREEKEISVVNTVDWELAPGIARNNDEGNKWVESIDQFEYGIHFKYSNNVEERCSSDPLAYQLQVFRKSDDNDGTGWGVRTMEHIPADAYIVTFIGNVHNLETDNIPDDDVFCHDLYLKDFASESDDGDVKESVTRAVSSAKYGNVSRFIDHSDSPNCIMQPMFSQQPGYQLTKLWICATTDIHVGAEITYDHFTRVKCLAEDESF